MKTTKKWNPKFYNDKHSFVYNYGESLIALLDPKPDERILDLGCGAGQLTFRIGKKAGEVIGIDKSTEMIEDAKINFPTIHFETADASNSNFEDKFDAIFSNATLHWIKNYKGAIKCMYKNLVDNGRLVLEFGGKGNIESIEKKIRENLLSRGYVKQSEIDLWYFPSIAEYTMELQNAGFNVTLAQLYPRPTRLADRETGIKDWITMFGSSFFKNVAESDIESIKEKVQKSLEPTLFKNGEWFADYKRLRIVAHK